MTIGQNSEYVLEHPFTKRAVKQYLSGNPKDLKTLLVILQEDMYHKMLQGCAKSYKKYKRENFPIVEEEIRSTPPPENLKAYLPIPQPECIIVSMKIANGKHRRVIINPLQLQIDFSKKEPSFQIAL